MKHFIKLRPAIATTLCLSVVLLTGCKEAVLDFRNAEVTHGKIYAVAANEPFTGKVTNVTRFKPTADLFEKVRALKGQVFRSEVTEILGQHFLCDIEVKQGIMHGDMTCTQKETGKPYLKASFKDGLAQGTATLYGNDGTSVQAKASFKDGMYDGVSEVFNSQNGKVVIRQELKADKLNGKFEKYDPSGLPLLHRATFTDGLYNGEEELFDAKTGKRIGFGQWSHGQLHGKAQRWDTNGELIVDEVYERHILKEDRLADKKPTGVVAAALSTDSCVEQWTVAHRKAVGQEVMISGAQLDEWEQWCKDGKLP